MKAKISLTLSQEESDKLLKQIGTLWDKAYPNWNKLTEDEQGEIKRDYFMISGLITTLTYRLRVETE